MKPTRHLAATATALVVSAVAAGAHPGHSHADLFSVLRQPLADWQHALIAAMTASTVGMLAFLATRNRRVPAVIRWAGSIGAAVGAAWLMA